MATLNSLGLDFYNQRTEQSYTLLYKTMHPTLIRHCLYKYSLESKEVIQLMVDEACVVIWERISTFNPTYKFSTWCFTISENLLNHNYNKNKNKIIIRIDTLESIDAYLPLEAQEQADTNDYNKLLDERLDKLQGKWREILFKKIYGGYSLKLLAKEYDYNSLSTFKSAYYKIYNSIISNNIGEQGYINYEGKGRPQKVEDIDIRECESKQIYIDKWNKIKKENRIKKRNEWYQLNKERLKNERNERKQKAQSKGNN